MESVSKGDVALEVGASSSPPNSPPPCSRGAEARAYALTSTTVWIGLPRSSKALLGVSGAQALAAIVCGCSLLWQVGLHSGMKLGC